MENLKTTPYTPPKLEIITYESDDIIATSGGNGYVPDDNVVDQW